MNDNFGNLKLLLDSNLSTHPRCKHGPTLLFSRQVGGMEGIVKKFYACSAYRNRKDCDFYQEVGSKVTQAAIFRQSQACKQFLANNDYSESFDSVSKAREEVEDTDVDEVDDMAVDEFEIKKDEKVELDEDNVVESDKKQKEIVGDKKEENEDVKDDGSNEEDVEETGDKKEENEDDEDDGSNEEDVEETGPPGVIKFCQDCGKVSTPVCLIHDTTNLSRADLDRPAKVLKPKSTDRKEAQYFFSDSTKEFLIDTITSQGFTHVLCIGCPSVYECLPANLSSQSMLLDLDPRFLSFYTSKRFLWFNFFNGHFFHGEESSTIFRDFLISCDNLLVILDPPFGAKTELISHSLSRVTDQLEMLSISATVSTIWVFPYFMERQVKQYQPNLLMSDYRVTYSGHVQFGDKEDQVAGARKLGSPVRLFTSIPLSVLVLPTSGGQYQLCGQCRVWVAVENRHCDSCGTCTSKDGRTYVHCTDCKRCVKPTYTHCTGCDRCKLPEHKCGGVRQERKEENEEKEVLKEVVEEKQFSNKRKSRKRNRHKRLKIPKKC